MSFCWKTFWSNHKPKTTDQMVKEFIELFPDKCMICSYHRYGIREGIISADTPVYEHYCIEETNEK